MKYQIILCLCVFSSLLLFSCKKTNNSDGLPTPTQNGSNVLACIKNGKVCVYKGKLTYSWVHGVQAGYSPVYGYEIFAANDDDNRNDLFMYIYAATYKLNKKYPLNVNGSFIHTSSYDDYNLGAVDNHSIYPDSNKSFIVFTKLTDSIISGTFEFHGVNDEHIAVDMTNGFFDIKAQ